MSNKRKSVFILIYFVVFSASAAQITFRNRDAKPRADNYNLRFGSLMLDLRYSIGLAYDDNSNQASTKEAKEDGTSLSNSLTVLADWPLHPNFSIQSGITVSYRWFLSGSGADGFHVSGLGAGGAADLSFDLKVGQNGLLTFQDVIRRDIDSIEISRTSNAEDFSLWKNAASIQYQSQLNPQINIAISGGRNDTWSDQDRFDFRNLTEYSLNSTTHWQVNSQMQMGPFISYSTTNYLNDDGAGIRHNDLESIEFGLQGNMRLGARLMVTWVAGFQDQGIRSLNNTRDTTSEDGYNGSFQINHQLTNVMEQQFQVSFRRNAGTSTTTNFSEDANASYRVQWEMIRDWEIRGKVDVSKTNESGPVGENADIYTTSLSLTHNLTPYSNVSLNYLRGEKFANLPNRDYERNQIGILFGLDF